MFKKSFIQIGQDGEMWIGSRKCRYQGLADVVLFGNLEDMVDHHQVGTKYLWVSTGGVLEMHGKEKLSWTHLEEHIFRDNVPAEGRLLIKDFGINCFILLT